MGNGSKTVFAGSVKAENSLPARWMRRVWFSVASAILLLMGLECFLRLVLGLGNPVLIAPDAACEYILKPNQEVHRFFAHTRINHYGMRSADFSEVPLPQSLRILFIGDSLTYGTSRVDQEKIFTEIVHRDLPAVIHQRVEVLNASAGNWAIDNELSWVRSRGIFQADVVLLVVNNADLTQPRATIAQFAQAMPEEQPSSALAEAYSRWIHPHIFGEQENRPSATSDTVIEKGNVQDLTAIHQLVSSQGGRLVLVYLPFAQDIPKESLAAETAFRNWAKAQDVPFLDLEPDEAAETPASITLDGDHLNARGHALVAAAIEKSWSSLVAAK